MNHACLTKSLESARTLSISYISPIEWITDIPVAEGGLGEMPSPLHLLASAAASCIATSIYLRATERGLTGHGSQIEAAIVEESLHVQRLIFTIHLPAVLECLVPTMEEIVRKAPVIESLNPNIALDINCLLKDGE